MKANGTLDPWQEEEVARILHMTQAELEAELKKHGIDVRRIVRDTLKSGVAPGPEEDVDH